jgi:hypothetical protein
MDDALESHPVPEDGLGLELREDLVGSLRLALAFGPAGRLVSMPLSMASSLAGSVKDVEDRSQANLFIGRVRVNRLFTT